MGRVVISMSVVSTAILAAKAEMRKRFWEEHVRYREWNKVVIRNLELLVKECADEDPSPVLTVLADGTYIKVPSNISSPSNINPAVPELL